MNVAVILIAQRFLFAEWAVSQSGLNTASRSIMNEYCEGNLKNGAKASMKQNLKFVADYDF